jgi:hypothetical protein
VLVPCPTQSSQSSRNSLAALASRISQKGALILVFLIQQSRSLTIPLGFQSQLAPHDMSDPVRRDLAMLFGEAGPDLLDGNTGFIARLLQLADDLQDADVAEAERRDFMSFQTSFAGMLSEMRKYRLCLTLAHQFMGQLEEEVRDAILGNAGMIISFRVGLNDAEILEKEFFPEFRSSDLVNLPNYNIYLKLMTTVWSRSRSARGRLAPIFPNQDYRLWK